MLPGRHLAQLPLSGHATATGTFLLLIINSIVCQPPDDGK